MPALATKQTLIRLYDLTPRSDPACERDFHWQTEYPIMARKRLKPEEITSHASVGQILLRVGYYVGLDVEAKHD